LHGAADVAEEDDGAPPQPGLPVQDADQLTAGPDRLTGGAAQVDTSPMGWTQAPGPALGDPPGRLLQEPLHLVRLDPGHLLEVLVAKQLACAVARAARRDPVLLDLSGHPALVEAARLAAGARPQPEPDARRAPAPARAEAGGSSRFRSRRS